MDTEERFEKIKQRQEQLKRQYEESERARIQVEERLIGLPKFMWEELEAQAKELGVTPSELVRVWLADRLIKN